MIRPGTFTPFPCADDVFKVLGITGTSYNVTGLTPGRPYSFRVVTREATAAAAGDDNATKVGLGRHYSKCPSPLVIPRSLCRVRCQPTCDVWINLCRALGQGA